MDAYQMKLALITKKRQQVEARVTMLRRKATEVAFARHSADDDLQAGLDQFLHACEYSAGVYEHYIEHVDSSVEKAKKVYEEVEALAASKKDSLGDSLTTMHTAMDDCISELSDIIEELDFNIADIRRLEPYWREE